MADLNHRAVVRLTGAALSMIALFAGGGALAAAPAFSAPTATDLPRQPQCGPDPLTLIDPCETLPASGPSTDSAQQIPWDVIDTVLFG